MAIALFKWLFPVLFNALHPVYVSVTEVNHNANDKTLEITCKIFADDFENVLTKKNNTAVSLSNPKNKAAVDKLIADYFRERLLIKPDGKNTGLTYLGYEMEEDAVYCYLQAENILSVKRIEAINTMLHDLNDKQINIMHVIVNGNRKSTKLDYPDSQAAFQF